MPLLFLFFVGRQSRHESLLLSWNCSRGTRRNKVKTRIESYKFFYVRLVEAGFSRRAVRASTFPQVSSWVRCLRRRWRLIEILWADFHAWEKPQRLILDLRGTSHDICQPRCGWCSLFWRLPVFNATRFASRRSHLTFRTRQNLPNTMYTLSDFVYRFCLHLFTKSLLYLNEFFPSTAHELLFQSTQLRWSMAQQFVLFAKHTKILSTSASIELFSFQLILISF